jgi:hypothetical protein
MSSAPWTRLPTGERLVDLAEVNGRVFVNNVSLGIYAEAVQAEGYRDAKLRTIADTVPLAIGPGEQPLDREWTGADGRDHNTAAACSSPTASIALVTCWPRARDRDWTPVFSGSPSLRRAQPNAEARLRNGQPLRLR